MKNCSIDTLFVYIQYSWGSVQTMILLESYCSGKKCLHEHTEQEHTLNSIVND